MLASSPAHGGSGFSLAGDRSTDMTSVLAPVRPTPVDNAEDSSPIERWETDGGHSWELT
jgi:hypothetical protein